MNPTTSYHATPTFRSAVAHGAWFADAAAAREWARKAADRYHIAFAVWQLTDGRIRRLETIHPRPDAA
jgi:hypothetical protein